MKEMISKLQGIQLNIEAQLEEIPHEPYLRDPKDDVKFRYFIEAITGLDIAICALKEVK